MRKRLVRDCNHVELLLTGGEKGSRRPVGLFSVQSSS